MSEEKKELPACPVETTLMLIGDKWKVLILRDLMPGTKRFGELKKSIGHVSQKVLTAQLRDMEEKAEVMAPAFPEEGRTPVFSFSAEKGREQSEMLRQLMNGASYMIPFVVVGGLFIALAQSFAGESSSSGLFINSVFWDKVHKIGYLAFELMYPILSGFLAFSIAGRAALAPAMIGAMIVTNGELLGTGEGTGFLGCIVVGYVVGYLVRWMNTWKTPKALKPMMPIFIIPLSGVSLVSVLFIFVLGQPIASLMRSLNSLLVYLADSSSTALLLGLVLGAMIGVDMGGPINKMAFFFGVASIAEGNLRIMGIASSSIAVAPLSMGVAAMIGGSRFSGEERGMGIYTVLMGILGISEGAIPFATSDPKHVIPSVVTGSAVAGAAAALTGVTSAAPHGGPIVGFLGATNHLMLYLLCIFAGTAVSTAMVLFLKKKSR